MRIKQHHESDIALEGVSGQTEMDGETDSVERGREVERDYMK